MKYLQRASSLTAILLLCYFVSLNGQDSIVPVTELLGTQYSPAVAKQMVDIDLDGNVDILGLADATISIQYGTNEFRKWSLPEFPINFLAYSVVATDLDEDGDPDLVALARPHRDSLAGLYAFYNDAMEVEWPFAELLQLENSRLGQFNSQIISMSGASTSMLVFSYTSRDTTYTTQGNIMAYDFVNNSTQMIYESPADKSIFKLAEITDAPLGNGITFGVNDFQDSLTTVFWVGFNEEQQFSDTVIALAEQVDWQFFIRDADGDGNEEFIYRDSSRTTLYWRALVPEADAPPVIVLKRDLMQDDYWYPLDANGDGLIDIAYNYSPNPFLNSPLSFEMRISLAIQADSVLSGTPTAIRINTLPWNTAFTDPKVTDIDQNGKDEFPAYYQTGVNRGHGHSRTGSYFYEWANDEWTSFSIQPRLSYHNLQPVYKPGSGQKQSFYASGNNGNGAAIYRLYDHENTGRYALDLLYTAPTDQDWISAPYDLISSLQSIDPGEGELYDIRYLYSAASPHISIPQGTYEMTFSTDGTVETISQTDAVLGEANYIDFFGSGEMQLVTLNPCVVYRDDDQDRIPEDTLFRGIQIPEWEFPADAIADLNGDGRYDMLSGARIFYQQPDTTFSVYELDLQQFYTLWSQTPVITDLNNDGLPDLILQSLSDLEILFNNGDETFTSYSTARQLIRPALSVRFEDIDNDGTKELVNYSARDIMLVDSLLNFCPDSVEDICVSRRFFAYDSSVTKNNASHAKSTLLQMDVVGDGDSVDLVFNGNLFYLGDPPPASIIDEEDPELTGQPTSGIMPSFPFPNPSADHLQIHCPDCNDLDVQLLISNSQGTTLKTFIERPATSTWPVADLTFGFYYYTLLHEDSIIASGLFLKQ